MVTEQLQEHDTSGIDDSLERNSRAIIKSTKFKQVPGVKELCNLLDKFTGKSGKGDSRHGWKTTWKLHKTVVGIMN